MALKVHFSNVVAVHLQHPESGHHAQERGHVKEVVHGHGEGDGGQEQGNHHITPLFDMSALAHWLGPALGDRQRHAHGRYQPIYQGRDKQIEELEKLDDTLLPHHQGGDVAEGTERPAGIGRNNDIDT